MNKPKNQPVTPLFAAAVISDLAKCDNEVAINLLLYHVVNWQRLLQNDSSMFDASFTFFASPLNDFRYPIIEEAYGKWRETLPLPYDCNELLSGNDKRSQFAREVLESISTLLTTSNSGQLSELDSDIAIMMQVIDNCPAWQSAKSSAENLNMPVKINQQSMASHFFSYHCGGGY